MKDAQQAIISMGSNVEDGEKILTQTLEWLRTFMTDIKASCIYKSRSTDGKGSYYNLVVKGMTTLTSEEFEIIAKKKESESGRKRPSEHVNLDIDLVALGAEVVRPTELCRLYFLQGLELLAR